MNVYILRHGETEGNLNEEFSGITDTPLTEKGREQARNVRRKLEGKSFDVVISSPLSRAVDTAELAVGGNIKIEENLKEMNFGIFEGMTYKEIQESYAVEMMKWTKEGREYDFVSGESLITFYNRVTEAYKKILKENQVENILIVAHSGVIRSILAHEISENQDHYWKYMIDNCGLSHINYSDGYTILKSHNL